MSEKQPDKEQLEAWQAELDRRLDQEEAIEEEYGGQSARVRRQEKAGQAPRGQTKGGFAERFRANRGFTRSARKPQIKIVDRTKK